MTDEEWSGLVFFPLSALQIILLALRFWQSYSFFQLWLPHPKTSSLIQFNISIPFCLLVFIHIAQLLIPFFRFLSIWLSLVNLSLVILSPLRLTHLFCLSSSLLFICTGQWTASFLLVFALGPLFLMALLTSLYLKQEDLFICQGSLTYTVKNKRQHRNKN